MPTIPDLGNASGGKMNHKYTIKDISELGIFAAIAIILNLPIFKIHITATGGSISFVMIPLFIIAIRHTWWKTLITCGIVYGLPACLISDHSLLTYLFDYLLAYGAISIISLFRSLILKDNKLSYLYLIISICIATFLRYVFATIDSIVIYELKFIPALIYNAPYVFITGAVGLVVIILLLKPLKILNKKYNN